MESGSGNAAAQADAVDATVLEEPADSLLDFVRDIVPVDWLSTLIVVVVALAVTAVVARLAVKLIRRVLSHDSVPLPSSSIFANIARVVVWAIGVSVVLSSCFGVDVTAAVAALGIGRIHAPFCIAGGADLITQLAVLRIVRAPAVTVHRPPGALVTGCVHCLRSLILYPAAFSAFRMSGGGTQAGLSVRIIIRPSFA